MILLTWLVQLAAVFTIHSNMTENQSTKRACTRNQVTTEQLIAILLNDYDSQVPPSESTVNVTVELHVQEVSSLSEMTADLELDLMYSEIWIDPRLAFRQLGLCAKNITLKASFRDKIWTPDTCIVNSKASSVHESPSSNTFLILYENGKVWSNWRIKVRNPCQFSFQMFPFDTQFCQLKLQTLIFNMESVHLIWDDPPLTFMNPVELPDYTLLDWQASAGVSLTGLGGNSDRLEARLSFSRRYGFYLLQAFFPSFFTVLLSWLSFSFYSLNVGARINLGFSTFIALVFQMSSIQKNLPRVSSIKCIDVWMIACVLFVFLTIPEMVGVYHLAKLERDDDIAAETFQIWLDFVRRRKRRRAGAKRRQRAAELAKNPTNPIYKSDQIDLNAETDRNDQIDQRGPVDRTALINPASGIAPKRKRRITTVCIDRLSLILYPICFLVFNVFYWWYYFINGYQTALAKRYK